MKSRTKHQILILIVMAVLVILFGIISLTIGSTDVGIGNLISLLLGNHDDLSATVIQTIRFPRVVAAIIMGGALALSGYLLQVFFGNPIAGPYVLGISSSAKLFVACIMVLMVKNSSSITSFELVLAAFTGSLISMGAVLVLSQRIKAMSLLVVCGVMIGYICTALTDFIVTFAEDSNIVNLHNWSLGCFSGISIENVKVAFFIIIACLIISLIFSKQILGYQLGESYAVNIGINIKSLRVVLIILSSMLSATVTAFAGPISFVGIAVPHIMRSIFKTANTLVMIPACFLGGAIITLICDDIARTAFAPTELSISTVTAFFLAPVVIVMIVKIRRPKDE